CRRGWRERIDVADMAASPAGPASETPVQAQGVVARGTVVAGAVAQGIDVLLVADVAGVDAHGRIGQEVPGRVRVEHRMAVLAHRAVEDAALPASTDTP